MPSSKESLYVALHFSETRYLNEIACGYGNHTSSYRDLRGPIKGILIRAHRDTADEKWRDICFDRSTPPDQVQPTGKERLVMLWFSHEPNTTTFDLEKVEIAKDDQGIITDSRGWFVNRTVSEFEVEVYDSPQPTPEPTLTPLGGDLACQHSWLGFCIRWG